MGFNNLINFMAFDMSDVIGFINGALRGLWAMLCEAIYPGIANLYQLFTNLGVLVYSDSFEAVYDKISLIIGIFMVFRVTFWLIEMLVNPDMVTDKEKNPGKIVQKVLVSVILLATTPTIFKYAFRIQYEIVKNQTIEKIIMPDSNPSDATESGRLIAAELFANFYTSNIESSDGVCDELAGDNGYGKVYENLKSSGTLNISNYCLNEPLPTDDEEYMINFNGIFATAVGIVVFWMILMYCINLGSRYAELIFLQVIAPVPIMCYLTPNKDNMLSKWVKQCTTTYLDLFIRIAIISFVIFLSKAILANENNIIFNISDSVQSGWMEVFLVLGLLMFAKKAPNLIQDLLPKGLTKASGDFGLSLKKRTDNMIGGKYAYGAASTVGRVIGKGATVGVAGAAITGAVGFLGGRGDGRVTGALGGMWRGFANGTKKGSIVKNLQTGIKQQQDVSKKKIDWEHNDSTWGGRMQQRMANTFGLEGKAEKFDNQIATYNKDLTKLNSQSSALSEVTSYVGNMEDIATKKLDEKNFSPEQKYQYQLQMKRRHYKAIYQAMSNGDEQGASRLANDEFNRINAQIESLVLEGKGPGTEEYEKVQKDRNKIEEIRNALFEKTYSAAQAVGDMTVALQETRDEFITKSLQDENGEVAIKDAAKHIQSVLEHPDNKDVFENFGSSAGGDTYESFDKLSKDAKKANTAKKEEIYQVKTAKEALENSEERKKSQADRNAVGGHQGGKK